MFQKLQKYDLITHTIFAMVNLCKVQKICQSSVIFFKITKHKITSHKLDVYTNGKFNTQKKLGDVHGTSNVILNLLDVCVLQHNEVPKHCKLEHLQEKLNHYRLEL
jgi:hypothetical protein